MSDAYETHSATMSSFGRRSPQVVPSNSADLDEVSKGLFLASAGTVAFVCKGDADEDVRTTAALPAGAMIPFFVRRVMETGTTATVFAIND